MKKTKKLPRKTKKGTVDVILIYPPSVFKDQLTNNGNLKSYRVGNKKIGTWPPIGLLYLAAVLEENNISCEMIDAFVQGYTLEETIHAIKKFSPKIVGISITTLQLRGAVQLAEAIKKELNGVQVCVGGPHISVDKKFVEKFSCFDFAIAGEAEITFPKLIKKALKKEKVPKYSIAQLPKELDKIPFPARKKIKISDYFNLEEPTATVITSRGCPFNCLFCSRVAISDRVRFRDPKLVVKEIEGFAKDYSNIVFLDDTFTLKKDHILNLCREMVKKGIKIKWTCNTRANLLDEEIIKAMKEAGCNTILIGVESGNENFRNKVVHKKINDNEIFKAVKMCKKAGITIGGYFMLGFPGEKRSDIKDTVNFAPKADLDVMSIHATAIYPGSELFKVAQKETKEDLLELWYKYARGEKELEDLPLVYVPKGIDFSEIEKARKEGYFKFYVRPKIIIKQIWKDLRSFKDFKRDILQSIMLLRFGKTSKDLK